MLTLTLIAQLTGALPQLMCHLQDRITKCGGSVSVDNIGRHMVNEALSMSRSIGDLHLKKYGVIALPDTRTMRVSHYAEHQEGMNLECVQVCCI